MEKAVFQHHLEYRVCAAPSQQPAIKPRRIHCRQIVAGNASDIVLHIKPFADPLPVNAGHDDFGMVDKMTGDAFGVAAFGGEIQLAAH